MKHLKLLASLLSILALCAFTFTSCNLFDDEEEEEEESNPSFNSYFNFTITRCERVGSVLILDWKLTNKTKKDVQSLYFEHYGSEFSDNLGKGYPNAVDLMISGGNWNATESFPILAGETITGSFRIRNFDSTNSATKANIGFYVTCATLGLNNILVTGNNFAITDNRVLSKGIQTNDDGLAWSVKSAEIDADGYAMVTFTVKNNTGKDLKDFSLTCPYTTYDNLGKGYNNCSGIRISGADWNIYNRVTTDFESGATNTYTIRTARFNTNATAFSAEIEVESDNYFFSDSCVRLLNIQFK